jgi:hypothetical protein
MNLDQLTSDDEAARSLLADWHLFKHTNARWIGDLEDEAANCFWLSRNGHGAGFFDRTEIWPRRVCDLLQAAARRFGDVTLFVNDAGKIDVN